jgi:GDP-4-dehydro-6-deoxy-D-mannose reductase
VLVTGAAGFIGTHLTRYLLAQGAEVVAIDIEDCDVVDTPRLRSIVARAQPDQVFHLAAMASVAETWERPAEAWRTNVLGTTSVLEAVRTETPRARVLVMSSINVHEGSGQDASGLIDEERPISPTSPYGVSKAAAEQEAARYFANFGVSALVARPGNIIGPGQSARFVLPSLCRRLLEARRDGTTAITMGRKDIERDFVDVREAVVALTAIVERGRPGRTYNVCSGQSTTIGSIADQLAELAGGTVEARPDERLIRPGDPGRLIGDPGRTAREIGWTARIPLAETLAEIWTAAAPMHESSVER